MRITHFIWRSSLGFFLIFSLTLLADSPPSQMKHFVNQKRKTDTNYLGDEARAKYLNKIICQARDLAKDKKFDQAIQLLLEQRKTLLEKGLLRSGHLKEGQPPLPDPLSLAIAKVRQLAGQEPVEMVDYYKYILNSFSHTQNTFSIARELILIAKNEIDSVRRLLDKLFDPHEQEAMYSQLIYMFANGRRDINHEKVISFIKQLPNDHVPESIQKECPELSPQAHSRIEPLFWKHQPQWHHFNLNNRHQHARHLKANKNYTHAVALCNEVLTRYQDGDVNTESFYQLIKEVRLICIYQQLKMHNYSNLINDAQEFLRTFSYRDKSFLQEAVALELVGNICLDTNAEIGKSVFSLPQNDLLAGMKILWPKLDSSQKNIIENYCWRHFPDWEDFNQQNRLAIAQKYFKHKQYENAIKYYQLFLTRYDRLPFNHNIKYLKAFLRRSKYQSFSTELNHMLKTLPDTQGANLQIELFPEILYLIRMNKLYDVASLLDHYHSSISSEKIIAPIHFITGYYKLLSNKSESGLNILSDVTKKYPRSRWATNAQLILENRDSFIRNLSLLKFATGDALSSKANTYIHNGDFDTAIDIFLKLVIEYPSHKEADKAYYYIGYYYTLKGNFEVAQNTLTIIAAHYNHSAYARKAQELVARIKQMS